MKYSERNDGPYIAMFSGVMFGLIPIAVKCVTSRLELSIYVGLFYRYLTGTAFLALPGIRSLREKPLSLRTVWAIAVDALFGSATAVCLYGAYTYIATGVATTIHYLYPLFVLLLSRFFFHAALKRKVVLSALLSFCGMIFLWGPGGADAPSLWGIGLAVLSAVCFSGYLVLMDRMAPDAAGPAGFSFVLNGFGALFLLLYTRFLGCSVFDRFFTLLIRFLPAGFFSMLAYLSLSVAVKKIGAAKASVLGTLEPVASLVGSALVLREHISARALLGCLLILLAAIQVLGEKS